MSSREDKAWYEEWFGHEYLEVYSHRDDDEASRDINNIENLLLFSGGSKILDLACGNGRHSVELAKRGHEVTGVDLSEDLLDVARDRAEKEAVEVSFMRCDMRDLPFDSGFDYVLNMFTSFGYFENDKENSKILASIHKTLVRGGRFLIDYINVHHVLGSLVAEDNKEVNGKMVRQQRSYNPETRRLEKKILISSEDGEKEFLESVRLYEVDEIIRMAESAGLYIESTFGSLQGTSFDQSAPRAVIIGRKT